MPPPNATLMGYRTRYEKPRSENARHGVSHGQRPGSAALTMPLSRFRAPVSFGNVPFGTPFHGRSVVTEKRGGDYLAIMPRSGLHRPLCWTMRHRITSFRAGAKTTAHPQAPRCLACGRAGAGSGPLAALWLPTSRRPVLDSQRAFFALQRQDLNRFYSLSG